MNFIKSSKLLLALLVAFFGQIYFRPFYTDFRFSLGVVTMGLFCLLMPLKLRDYFVIALSVLGFRVILACITGIDFLVAFESHYPSAIYYLSFGLLLHSLQIKNVTKYPATIFIYLLLADSFSNWLELIIRGDFGYDLILSRGQSIYATALIRSVLTLITFFFIRFYPEIFEKEAEKRKLATWILNQSKLQGEVTFFRKSEEDIEKAMQKAHRLYQLTKKNQSELPITLDLPRKTLSIARDVHEIKKDYRRMREALSSLVLTDLPEQILKPTELLHYLCDDLVAYGLSLEKNILISRNFSCDIKNHQTYHFVSLVNNLVINAIEACPGEGIIMIQISENATHQVIEVMDNGPGIVLEEQSLIFEPGFSTKFDAATGEMSTGIGLAQVHFIVYHIFKGSIELKSEIGVGTTFRLYIPKSTRERGQHFEL